MAEPTGLKAKDLQSIKSLLLNFLKTKTKFSIAFFGSRARGDHKQYSDLDLWIEATPELSLSEKSNLQAEFEDSELSIKVDLVTPFTCLPEYKSEIESEKKLWFEEN